MIRKSQAYSTRALAGSRFGPGRRDDEGQTLRREMTQLNQRTPPRNRRWAGFMIFLGLMVQFHAGENFPQAGVEQGKVARAEWMSSRGLAPTAAGAGPVSFFSFNYGGKPSADFLAAWTVHSTEVQLDATRMRRTIDYSDASSGLVVRCVAIVYADFPTVEWTLYFRNEGKADTPIISAVRAIDSQFQGKNGLLPVLHYNEGGYSAASAFQPHELALSDERSRIEFTPGGGRGSNDWLPYFNFEYGAGGVIVAVGWPGQWLAAFDSSGRVQAGQELTNFILHPGEEVRSPLIALQFWQGGDWTEAQNIWRRWMLAHCLPTVQGQSLTPQLAANSSHQFGEMIHADEANQIAFIDGYLKNGIKLDYWWMDAGWYSTDGIWSHVGTWEVDKSRFPHGLRAISDHARAKGVKTIVWFEPERVSANSWLWDNHPEWLLGQDPTQRLLNLGNPGARRWASEYFSQFITDQGIDLYRQDHNIAPLPFWRGADAPNRQGITEIRYVEGYLAYWDALRQAHPELLIDSCASGGRRNDLETARRSVPLLRNDYVFEPLGQQGHTFGLSTWFPYQGTGTLSNDSYIFRSAMAWAVTVSYDMREANVDFSGIRRLIDQWRSIAALYLADYYPLTQYSLSQTEWLAWQFNRPENGDGVVQAFRRAFCSQSIRVRLRGLKASSTYVVTNMDDGTDRSISGRELMDSGVVITSPTQPGAVLYRYRVK